MDCILLIFCRLKYVYLFYWQNWQKKLHLKSNIIDGELKRGAFQSRRVHFHDGSIYFSRAICKIALFPRYLQLIPEWETVAKLFHTGPDRLPNTDTRSALASFVTLANKKAWPPRWQRYYKAGCANAYAHPPDEFSRCSLAITVGISRVIKNDG